MAVTSCPAGELPKPRHLGGYQWRMECWIRCTDSIRHFLNLQVCIQITREEGVSRGISAFRVMWETALKIGAGSSTFRVEKATRATKPRKLIALICLAMSASTPQI